MTAQLAHHLTPKTHLGSRLSARGSQRCPGRACHLRSKLQQPSAIAAGSTERPGLSKKRSDLRLEDKQLMHELPAVCQLNMFWPRQHVHSSAQHSAAGSLWSCATIDPPVCRPDSWRQREALQQPQYPDAAAVDEAIAEINRMPPLVFAGECRTLQQRLAACAAGDAFWLQGGDCAGGQLEGLQLKRRDPQPPTRPRAALRSS